MLGLSEKLEEKLYEATAFTFLQFCQFTFPFILFAFKWNIFNWYRMRCEWWCIVSSELWHLRQMEESISTSGKSREIKVCQRRQNNYLANNYTWKITILTFQSENQLQLVFTIKSNKRDIRSNTGIIKFPAMEEIITKINRVKHTHRNTLWNKASIKLIIAG